MTKKLAVNSVNIRSFSELMNESAPARNRKFDGNYGYQADSGRKGVDQKSTS
jgi:hypothetical protein